MSAQGRKNRAFHRRRQSLRHRQILGLRHRLQAAAARIPVARQLVAGVLLHRRDRGSGVFVDSPADRLARLQRLLGRHQGHQGVRRPDRPPQGQGQHGHRARGRCHGTRAAHRSHGAVLRRRRLPLAGRGGAAPRRARHGDFDDLDAAADGGRRIAPAGRHLHRHRRNCANRSAATRPSGRRATRRASRAASASTRRSSCSAGQRRRGRRRGADDDFED